MKLGDVYDYLEHQGFYLYPDGPDYFRATVGNNCYSWFTPDPEFKWIL